MGQKSSIPEVAALLKDVKSAVVLAHYNPDSDAYGSSAGLTLGLRAAGVRALCVNENGIIDRYRFIPGTGDIQDKLPEGDFDLLIACDCGDQKRLGETFLPQLSRFPKILNIDHHGSNTMFGTWNHVRADASSTAEIVFELLVEMERLTKKKLVSPDVANALFAGLSADTGSFKYSSTTAHVFEVAQQLIARGASAHKIAESLYSNERLNAVKLQAEALVGVKISHGGKVAKVTVTADMMKRYGATADDTEALVERTRDIEGVEIAVLLREEEGLWKASLRAKGEHHDVAKIAVAFGGGGHRPAAGFRWRGTGPELEARLTAEIDKLFVPR